MLQDDSDNANYYRGDKMVIAFTRVKPPSKKKYGQTLGPEGLRLSKATTTPHVKYRGSCRMRAITET